MARLTLVCALCAAVALSVIVAGCNRPTTPTGEPPPPLPEVMPAEASPPETAPADEAGEIDWLDGHAAGIAQAGETGKLIMMDFFVPWAPEESRLDNTAWKDPEIRELATRFVCVRIDCGKEADVAAQYRVPTAPAVLFVTSGGREVGRIEDTIGADEILAKMREVLKED